MLSLLSLLLLGLVVNNWSFYGRHLVFLCHLLVLVLFSQSSLSSMTIVVGIWICQRYLLVLVAFLGHLSPSLSVRYNSSKGEQQSA